jgi:hypothetical protein
MIKGLSAAQYGSIPEELLHGQGGFLSFIISILAS